MAFTQTPPNFQCAFSTIDNPDTPGLVRSQAEWIALRSKLAPQHGPNVGDLRRFDRKMFVNGQLTMPDGVSIKHWGFEGEAGTRTLPSEPIRVSSGDLVQVTLGASKRQHTIHHHGIEPSTFNDGVGHTSFEVTGNYTYQWRAHPRTEGTFFYHCHVNTPLHVAMGLFGPIIIDPPGTDPKAPPPKKPFLEAPADWTYHVEAVWAPFAVDPRWHQLNHAAGMCGEDAGLNIHQPKYFLINDQPQTPDGAPISAPNVAVRAKAGQTILIRTINASYVPITFEFGNGLDPLMIETDGRPIRTKMDLSGISPDRAGDLVAVPWSQTSGRSSAAERYGFLIKNASPGVYPVEMRWHNWITDKVEGYARTTITVEA
jgi:FtsP/CotA-like multicopper oxidase with cupredoxin domain